MDSYSLATLQSLKRKEVQSIAKTLGLKANLSTAILITEILAASEKSTSINDRSQPIKPDGCTDSLINGNETEDTENFFNGNINSVVSKPIISDEKMHVKSSPVLPAYFQESSVSHRTVPVLYQNCTRFEADEVTPFVYKSDVWVANMESCKEEMIARRFQTKSAFQQHNTFIPIDSGNENNFASLSFGLIENVSSRFLKF